MWSAPAFGQAGDAVYGRDMLRARRCTICHPVGAKGGSAPDLGKPREGAFSPDALAATMWNHAPKMWAAMEERQMPLAGLTQSDIANLYAHFYALRYFDPKGDAKDGKKVFEAKGCTACHAVDAEEAGAKNLSGAPTIDKWATMLDPVLWVESMWNHGANMSAQFAAKGVEWPQFSLQEMVDLLAYVESQPAHAGNLPYLRLGDWQAGEQAFADLGCSTCHSLGATEAGKVDLLAEAQRQPLLSGLAVDMWNHRPQMEAQAKSKGVELKPFEADQMANVTAYLFRRGYFQEQGDAKRGAEVYATKECASCHDKGEAGAPKLNALTAVDLASAIWTHGPNMKAQMDYLEKDWPELSAADVANLVAYVQSR
ncbi:MAG: c-type cytochrome [Bryobacterales bacterium]